MQGCDADQNTMLNLIVIHDLHKSKDSHLSQKKLCPPIPEQISVLDLCPGCLYFEGNFL